MPDSNTGPLPQKPGGLPMSHHIYVTFTTTKTTTRWQYQLCCYNYYCRTTTSWHYQIVRVNHWKEAKSQKCLWLTTEAYDKWQKCLKLITKKCQEISESITMSVQHSVINNFLKQCREKRKLSGQCLHYPASPGAAWGRWWGPSSHKEDDHLCRRDIY